MIIDIHDLQRKSEPLTLSIDFSEKQLELENNTMSLSQPVRSELRITLVGERVNILGKVAGELEIACCRCLKPFRHSVNRQLNLEYWPDPPIKREGAELELSYGDLNIGFYRNHEIDLRAVISEQIVLEVPMKPVCREDCKGLCDQCGADLNENVCSCGKEKLDPRLEVLRDLSKRMTH